MVCIQPCQSPSVGGYVGDYRMDANRLAICHLLASSSGRKQSLPTAFDPKMPFSAGNNQPEAGLKVAFSVEPSNHLVFCRLYDENGGSRRHQ